MALGILVTPPSFKLRELCVKGGEKLGQRGGGKIDHSR